MSIVKYMLDKRRRKSPFLAETAENFSLPGNADDSQNNSYYFSGHTPDGSSLLFRFARRGQNKTEIWFAFKDREGNAYINSNQLFEGDVPAGVKCLAASSEWEFHWAGELTDIISQMQVAARFTGRFRASGGIFEFGHDVCSSILARTIARQKWSKTFFKELKENDQVHYEQPGKIEGVLLIGQRDLALSYPAMRDHSFGKRDWQYMNRHVWIMALLEDGSSLNISWVSYPVLNNMQTGYYISNDKTICVESAEILADIVPNSVPPSFTCRARLQDGRTIELDCRREMEFAFPMGNGEYVIHEGIGAFDLNGLKGRGVLEFGWNSDAARYLTGGS